MEIITIDAVIRSQSNDKIQRVISLGPINNYQLEQLDSFIDLIWPLDQVPQSAKDLESVLFKAPKKLIQIQDSFKSTQEILDFVKLDQLLQLDHQERQKFLNKLLYPRDNSQFAFLPPVFVSKKERTYDFYLCLVPRPALGCEHLESSTTFCKLCDIDEKLCRRCNQIKCNCLKGKNCECGASYCGEGCSCKVQSKCQQCQNDILESQQAIKLICGCQVHSFCYPAVIVKGTCQICDKDCIQGYETAQLQLEAFREFVEDCRPKCCDDKHIILYSYKCSSCQETSVDTRPWMCHSCGSVNLVFVEFIEVSMENAIEFFKNEFKGDIGGAIQIFCDWASSKFVLYDQFLNFEDEDCEEAFEMEGQEE
ncbi:hypothetical protein SS50377_28064 [Spironucleus salmonicida]|uniref:Uncharacterized protein n=1 Tax=Spironucleus salmonicida TaxID=348837 RepID=V6LFY5_9EUKA|nr:hypothetical protein SS50377_28064 [Spironucleus salmonicida]|eukprot:EST42616.1 Hypothetical protein SS50377_17936 [Spironucleus salmonicida]